MFVLCAFFFVFCLFDSLFATSYFIKEGMYPTEREKKKKMFKTKILTAVEMLSKTRVDVQYTQGVQVLPGSTKVTIANFTTYMVVVETKYRAGKCLQMGYKVLVLLKLVRATVGATLKNKSYIVQRLSTSTSTYQDHGTKI